MRTLFLRVVDICLEKKKRRFWDEAGADYLPTSRYLLKAARKGRTLYPKIGNF